MRGNEIFKMAVRSMAQSAQEALDKARLSMKDIRAVIPHQANHRILTSTRGVLGLSEGQMFINIDRYGNTGASSIPIALGEFLHANPIDAGEHVLFVAFGGGLTWGAAVLRWADIASVKRERRESMRKDSCVLTG
jgi:3-oxoacyl-[acyl-carrier-protein] synthase-3